MDSYAFAADIVRTRDRDRYIADLFAPAAARKHLFALHAFAAEVVRVREVVSEPALGEVRLTWWREAIANGESGGQPVAAALIETIRALKLPPVAFDMLIEARIFDLYGDTMPTLNDLEGYAGETASSLFQLGALALASGVDTGASDAAGHAGVAETLVGVLQGLARDPRRFAKYAPDALLDAHGATPADLAAQSVTPGVVATLAELRDAGRDHLAAAKSALAALPVAVLPAFLPLALTEARLKRLERNAATPFAVTELPAWRRQWIIWRAARRRPAT